MNNSCKELFEKETKALLTRLLMPDEKISQGDDYDFFTTSGITKRVLER